MKNKVMHKILLFILASTLSLFGASIDTTKSTYQVGESIKVTVNGMLGNNQDWVGIYQAGASNDWDNIVAWAWTNGVNNGTITLDPVAAGNYDVRAFYANSFNIEDTASFKVTGGGGGNASISTSKSTYNAGEKIKVTVNGMLGNDEDWIGIYNAGASNDWNNVKAWAWTNGVNNGTITLDGVIAGNYEARAFFANSFNVKATASFNVSGGGNQAPVVLENAEGGISGNWETVLGNYSPKKQNGGYQSNSCVKLTPNWVNNKTNNAEYWLYTNGVTNTILDIDVGGVGPSGGHVGGIHRRSRAGWMPHYFVGVKVNTLFGQRVMIWDSWFTHEGFSSSITDYGNGYVELTFPSPIELVRGYGYDSMYKWNHFRVNLQSALQSLEDGNSITSVVAFVASGGYLDNITLSPR